MSSDHFFVHEQTVTFMSISTCVKKGLSVGTTVTDTISLLIRSGTHVSRRPSSCHSPLTSFGTYVIREFNQWIRIFALLPAQLRTLQTATTTNTDEIKDGTMIVAVGRSMRCGRCAER